MFALVVPRRVRVVLREEKVYLQPQKTNRCFQKNLKKKIQIPNFLMIYQMITHIFLNKPKNTQEHQSSLPIILFQSTPFSIYIRTFSRSYDLIVTKDGSGKTVLFLVSFHPLSQKDSTCNRLSKTKTRYLEEFLELDFEVDMKRAKQLVRDVLEHMPYKKTSNIASFHLKRLSRRSFLSTKNFYLIVFGTSLMMCMKRTENLLRNLKNPNPICSNFIVTFNDFWLSLRTCSLMVSSVTSINVVIHLFHQLLKPLGMASVSLNTTAMYTLR
ncbi:hypothetical protein VP01_2485g4 [Puccinia sorghi]|uniref:Uncharacterized protein n=1 Tax=Puccinia sorghi TaxID=27349 RepID=A0A0L6V6G8_9BASI|nr:hypothetical protein VP01_2485g4 [Puccinia sorghi]